jgi:hypothetical protein
MIADPEKSLEYFEKAAAGEADDAEFGTTLTPIITRAEYEAAITGPGRVVVRSGTLVLMYRCRAAWSALRGVSRRFLSTHIC